MFVSLLPAEDTLSPARAQALARQRRSPWPEPGGQLLFLYQGTAQTRRVELAGELTGWHSFRLRFQRGPGHLFYLRVCVPLDARLEYKFLVDKDWTLDPWNPLRVSNGIGGVNSAVELAAYRHEHRLVASDPPPGRLDCLLLQGQALAGPRRLQIYQPAGLRADRRYPVLYFQDGSDYIERAQLPKLLDCLISNGEIPPVLAVCIEPRNRSQEYGCNDKYGQLLLEEILPLVESRYPVQNAPQARTLVGSSLGGLISCYLACRHSHRFGQVLGQSSSFQYAPDKLRSLLQQASPRRQRFYLSAGRFEGLIQANRNLVRTLAETGYDYKYREHNEGHNWTHWSNRLSEGLIYLLGKNT